jgi:hypothetical protein
MAKTNPVAGTPQERTLGDRGYAAVNTGLPQRVKTPAKGKMVRCKNYLTLLCSAPKTIL